MVRTYATTRKTTTVINSCNHNQQYVVIRNQYLNGGSRSSSSSNDKPLVTSMSGNCFEDGASIGQIQCCLSHGSCSSAAREWCKTARGTTVRILAHWPRWSPCSSVATWLTPSGMHTLLALRARARQSVVPGRTSKVLKTRAQPPACDTVAERLGGWTRNPSGSARRGLDPLGDIAIERGHPPWHRAEV